jgi:hypothetical protein
MFRGQFPWTRVSRWRLDLRGRLRRFAQSPQTSKIRKAGRPYLTGPLITNGSRSALLRWGRSQSAAAENQRHLQPDGLGRQTGAPGIRQTRQNLQEASCAPTLSELNRCEPHWVWWNCGKCRRWVAVPLAPFIIRWGTDASGDLLCKSLRCTKCGHRGGSFTVPSHCSLEVPSLRFPARYTPGLFGPSI